MTGTFLNIIAVLIGGSLGTLFGARLPERIRESVLWALGLFTIALGAKMTFDSHNALITLGSVLLGGLLGEWWRIDEGLKRFGGWLEARFNRSASAESTARFIRGYVSASLIFCVGPMTILGAIQDGLKGDFQLLAIKSVLDGFAALAFSASLGIGVMFSVITIFLYQGALSLLAGQADRLLTTPMIDEMTAVGGLLVMGIGFSALLELRPIRVANYLPALVVAPVVVAVLRQLGVAGF
ncbi:MAG TPA: DUF554 domain-containing protein [Anaerolineales bacterium]|nr:DUF554 domain-containing protein [Anaerolineales bacterium]